MAIIKNQDYRLIVAKGEDGDYLVNFYSKRADERVKGIEGVIEFMGSLDRGIIGSNPLLRGLSEYDERIILAVREVLIKRLFY